MAGSDSDIDFEDSFDGDDDNDSKAAETSSSANSKSNNLTKRRQIDNMLAERRLQKQISDYDFD
ncbi:hypothetical protein SAMN05216214_10447 [Atopomonas hussainii]|uniref:Uncharacterized protein n=1 Tax=Atopomonas hussainii TaxID=1429083 RepID=A0A1H7IR94_9GAMM|nr:hypothetical protein [Atopomonas hussainii]SEK64804.1 hypothetical protein SAMN05216214_10447 [Atopomonas hussainii]